MEKKNLKFLIIIGITILIIIIFLPGYTKLQDLIAENKNLEKRLAELTKSLKELEAEKEKLESDILYIEKVARERLGVVREGEVIIKEKP